MSKDNKCVVLGVSGGIAAYKAVELASALTKSGITVKVIMTANARKFVTPLSFQTVTRNPVVCDMFEEPDYWDVKHISLAKEADLTVIVPATANIIGKIASGIADDMLTTTVMATKSPVLIVPAMNCDMYDNPVVTENIEKLLSKRYHFIEPTTGYLACGTEGKGRLPDTALIIEKIHQLLAPQADLALVNILITAGPTREPIDPVRHITNRSSGKMGYALGLAALERGANVTVVTGPVGIGKHPLIKYVDVVTANEMYDAVMSMYGAFDVLIMAAAVADYRPRETSSNKIKKSSETMNIALVKNPDIAKALGKVKEHRILVGFCAETENLEDNARTKLNDKNFDLIVANDVTMAGAGFEADTNIVKLFKRDGSMQELPILSKMDVAYRILDEILELRQRRKNDGSGENNG